MLEHGNCKRVVPATTISAAGCHAPHMERAPGATNELKAAAVHALCCLPDLEGLLYSHAHLSRFPPTEHHPQRLPI
jgi:hypothetical protein